MSKLTSAVDAATNTFRRRGFAETSIGDLTAASGASRARLYKLHGYGRALLAAALARYAARLDLPDPRFDADCVGARRKRTLLPQFSTSSFGHRRQTDPSSKIAERTP